MKTHIFKKFVGVAAVAVVLCAGMFIVGCGDDDNGDSNDNDGNDPQTGTYSVTVTGGTGGGNFAEGATVVISAGTPPTNHTFKNWTTTSAGVTFANANNATTTFTMPANAVTVIAIFESQQLTAPTGVSASATSSSSITVSWNAVTGATGYYVYRSASSSGTFTQVGSPTTTSFTNTGLSANTTYFYRVAAYNSGGTGAQSSTASATTQQSSQQTTIGSCTIANGSCLNGTQADCFNGTWSPTPCPAEPLGYCRFESTGRCIDNVTPSHCGFLHNAVFNDPRGCTGWL